MPSFRAGNAIMSKIMSLNHKEITFKGEEINNYIIQTIHFGIMEKKVIVFMGIYL